MARILIIDDDPAMVQVISDICKERGHQTIAYSSGQKAIDNLATHGPQLVITDVRMDKVGGMEVLKECKEVIPSTPVIMITAYKQLEVGIEAMKMGAYDYITKPFKVDELQLSIQRALDYNHDKREIRNLRQIVKEKYRFENIIGTSSRMQEIYNLIAKVADTDSTILIQGESGTGKELVARALHFNSNRQHQPFVALNCSALPENLLESELFGHKKGSFTGAAQDKIGLFEEAELGTIFLDEVNSMAVSLQTKLLRVLQERQIRRVGDTKSAPINVRVLAATNEGLQEKIKSGHFREDLYYRLAVIPIEMPALRERLDDIPLLVNHFLHKNATHTGTEPKKIDPKALDTLQHYRWPGNVRELENAIERACALCDDGIIRPQDLPPQVVRHAAGPVGDSSTGGLPVGQSLDEYVREQERRYIDETIKFNANSRERAAKMLGISMATLYRKLEVKKTAEGRN
ncbi:MAG TPA: sigma-54 dependent transcriptional regulator [Chthoniobacteraceae bacterium]|jgi:DNA-binding NtrC family response regulator|nr:sigma-54 dependent transcriptional regulator [Chthoniobacteraceae bacterium]